MTIFEHIAHHKVLPAVVVPRAEQAVPLAEALKAGGLKVMEVTLRNADAPESIRRICSEVEGMRCGAGTILSIENLDTAIEAGAEFGLSPGFNPSVVRAAVERGFPFIPGVHTAGEMEQSLELGCPWVKLFPAEAAGGVKFLKAVAAPYGHTDLRIIPLGGISPDNMADYLALDIVPAVGGSWLGNAKLLNAGNYAEITQLAQAAMGRAHALRRSIYRPGGYTALGVGPD
jgi:2-dehydro-3-deoxyphosphogluconate aldolase/(4S)-4-hydroxy-2-oxoglutarate aldolase